MKLFAINIGLEDEWGFSEGDNCAPFIVNPKFGQQIRLGHSGDKKFRYDPYKDKDNVKILDGAVTEDSKGKIQVKEMCFDYNDVSTNCKNLNPMLTWSVEVNDDTAPVVIILTYGSEYRFLRHILDKKCEIINTFKNKEGAHGCVIKVPYDMAGTVIKAEASKGENDFYHLNVSFENGEIAVSNNSIKKADTIKTLIEFSKKKKYTGFKIESKRLLCENIICRQSEVETVCNFVETVPVNDVIKEGYKIWGIPDEVLSSENPANDAFILDLVDMFKKDHIRSALVWNLSNVPYEVIQKFRFLYIFTLAQNGTIKNTKSN